MAATTPPSVIKGDGIFCDIMGSASMGIRRFRNRSRGSSGGRDRGRAERSGKEPDEPRSAALIEGGLASRFNGPLGENPQRATKSRVETDGARTVQGSGLIEPQISKRLV